MTSYRPGGHWRTTIVRVGTGPADEFGRRPDDELVAQVVDANRPQSEREALARRICELLSGEDGRRVHEEPSVEDWEWQPTDSGSVLGNQRLAGYRMRDYDQAIATLAMSRDSQGITKTALAKAIGCLRVEVYRWLTGKVEAHGRRFFDLAHALGFDVVLVPRDDE